MPILITIATLVLLLLTPTAGARDTHCVESRSGPVAFIPLTVDTEPVDVTIHDESDFQQRLVSYGGDLYVTWLTEEEEPEVSEFLFMRSLGTDGWGPGSVVNNPVPGEGEFDGVDIRVAGYDFAVHEGLLWFFWSTPSREQTEGTNGDIVYRTFDGESWGAITEITPPGDEAIDVTPSVVSTGDRLVVVWASGTEEGRRIMVRWLDEDEWGPTVPVTDEDEDGDVFNPRVAAAPGGTLLVWHHRNPLSQDATVVTIRGRPLMGTSLGEVFPVSGSTEFEDAWIDLRWFEDRMLMVWQRTGKPLGFERSRVIYREWTIHGLGPEVDITGGASGGFNGRPSIGMTDEGPRVYWDSTDDGVTLGTSEDLVWRELDKGGSWGPLNVFQADPGQSMVRVTLVEHRGDLWASWMANVTFVEAPDWEPHQTWDVFVAPAHRGSGPFSGASVEAVRQRCEDEADSTELLLRGPGGPLADAQVTVILVDPSGTQEAVVMGTTDEGGRLTLNHGYEKLGLYTVGVVLDGGSKATLSLDVDEAPSRMVVDERIVITTTFFLLSVALLYLIFHRWTGGRDR